LKEIQIGNITKEGKEVLQAVYPEYYEDMKAKVLKGLAEAQAKGKTIPTAKRLGLSYFLDQNLDSSLKPQSMMANQMTFQSPRSTQQAPNPRPSSSKHLTLSTRYQTPLQQIAGRNQ